MNDGKRIEQTGKRRKLPPDPDKMNAKRSRWAFSAICEFQAETGSDDECVVSDLLADLRHMLDRYPKFGKWEDALSSAEMHYEDETTPCE